MLEDSSDLFNRLFSRVPVLSSIYIKRFVMVGLPCGARSFKTWSVSSVKSQGSRSVCTTWSHVAYEAKTLWIMDQDHTIVRNEILTVQKAPHGKVFSPGRDHACPRNIKYSCTQPFHYKPVIYTHQSIRSDKKSKNPSFETNAALWVSPSTK